MSTCELLRDLCAMMVVVVFESKVEGEVVMLL
jgi:hypothetical protein